MRLLLQKFLGSIKRQSVRRKKSSKKEEITSKKTEKAKTEKKRVKTKNPPPSNIRISTMLNQKPSQQSIDVVNLEEEEKMKVPSPTIISLVHSPG